jgi:hypothetical protein
LENLPSLLFALSPSWMALPSRKLGQKPYGLAAKEGDSSLCKREGRRDLVFSVYRIMD